MKLDGGRRVSVVTVDIEPSSSHEGREDRNAKSGRYSNEEVVPSERRELEKPSGTRYHHLNSSDFRETNVCLQRTGENSDGELCTRNQRGAVAHLHATKPQGITCWKSNQSQ